MRRAVFLDRDGVLNEAIVRGGRPYPPSRVEEVKLIPDTVSLGRLKEAGFLLLVVTNQPDVARKTQSRDVVEAINAVIQAGMPIDEFFVCWHDDAAACDCRKPKPGLLQAAAAKWNIDLRRSFMIGDRWRDIDAGAAAGCATVWIDRQYNERAPHALPDFHTDSLQSAVEWILASS